MHRRPRRTTTQYSFVAEARFDANTWRAGGPLIDAGHQVELVDADRFNLPHDAIIDEVERRRPQAVLIGHAGSTLKRIKRVRTVRSTTNRFGWFRQLLHADPDQVQLLYVTPHRWTGFFDEAKDRVIQLDQRRWNYTPILATKHLSPLEGARKKDRVSERYHSVTSLAPWTKFSPRGLYPTRNPPKARIGAVASELKCGVTGGNNDENGREFRALPKRR